MCAHCHPSRSPNSPQFETSQSPSRLRRRSGLSRRVKRRCQRGSVCCTKEKNRLSVDFICLFDSPLDCWSVHGARGGAAPAQLARANADKPNPPSSSAQTNMHPRLWVFHEANTHSDSSVAFLPLGFSESWNWNDTVLEKRFLILGFFKERYKVVYTINIAGVSMYKYIQLEQASSCLS